MGDEFEPFELEPIGTTDTLERAKAKMASRRWELMTTISDEIADLDEDEHQELVSAWKEMERALIEEAL